MRRTCLFIFAVLSVATLATSGRAQTVNVNDAPNSFFFTADELSGDVQTRAAANDILLKNAWFQLSSWLDDAPCENISISIGNTSSATDSYLDFTTATEPIFDGDLNFQVGLSPSGMIDFDIDVVDLTVQTTLPFVIGPTPVIGSLDTFFDYGINGISVQTTVFADNLDPITSQFNFGLGDSYFPTDVGAAAFDIQSFSNLLNSLQAETLLDSVPFDLLSTADFSPNFQVTDLTSQLRFDFELTPGEGETSFSLSTNGSVGVTLAAIPEPSTFAMISFLGVVVSLRRSRQRY